MKIKSLKAKNFKSFLPEGIDYNVQDGLNTIVGENNVGKSNITKILSELILLMENQNDFKITEAFQGNIDNAVELEIQVILSGDDIEFLMTRFSVPINHKEEFIQIFGKNLTIHFIFSRFTGPKITTLFGKMIFIDNRGAMDITSFGKGYHPKDWLTFINGVSQKSLNLVDAVNEALSPSQSEPTPMFQFNQNTLRYFHELFNETIMIFSEFRERPSSEVRTGVFSSPTGREVASVLFNLKNGGRKKGKRFEQIQSHFTQIFPNLKLDTREGHQIFITKSNDYEIEQNAIGAGIIEIIILLTHLIGTHNHVFVLDEPELHLHPHAKRSISKLIRTASETNQIICVTHSTNFIHMNSINNITYVQDKNGHSELGRLPPNYFTDDEIKKLQRITESRQKEFLFSRAVLLVEGDTEVGAMPILAQRIRSDLDMHNISVIGVDSHYFALFSKLLRGFRIPHIVMLDNDTIYNIETSIDVDSQKIITSSLIRQLDDLGELTDEDKIIIKSCENEIIPNGDSSRYNDESVKKLKNLIKKYRFIHLLPSDFEGLFSASTNSEIVKSAKKNFRGSKVLQGRHIAEKITYIPSDLKKIIENIVKLST
ncbi:ATP-dependent endonuclease [Nitrosarchaeum sp. AC2]|uniref:ATP-dependent nuclease n=1 Tax=Nitrosarchaeum sp. AC2 TaxID=2259673 RepID=UPI0015CB19B2|nr:AAA family ATPase [Nitrosarchaeum sp. AC2]QLH11007.1 hypothetical protein DSQ20_05635 [Nitrosarchaeum sp. AC2]